MNSEVRSRRGGKLTVSVILMSGVFLTSAALSRSVSAKTRAADLASIAATADSVQRSKASFRNLPDGYEVLENGLLRLVFNTHTGQFEARAVSAGEMRLYKVGPALEINGKVLLAKNATRIRTSHRGFKDAIGDGERLIVQYVFQSPQIVLNYELNVYNGKPWIGAVAYLPEGGYNVGSVSLIRGRIRVPSAFRTRVYVNSGTAGGDTGVWPVGERRWDSAQVSVLYGPQERQAVGFGFYSFYRASTSVSSRYLGPSRIGVIARADYHDYRPTLGKLRTESLLLDFRSDPLRILNDWTNASVVVVKPKFDHNARTGLLNTWYMYGNQITQKETLRQARLLRQSELPGYGISVVSTGEWQRQHTKPGDVGDTFGFGETTVDRGLYPNGLRWLVGRIQALGLDVSFGANYAYAAPDSSLVKRNVPWVDKVDHSRLEFGFPIDFTNPAAQKWLYDLAHRAVSYGAVEWWSDFGGGPTRGNLYNPREVMGWEDVREGLQAIRRGVGRSVMMEPYCCEQDIFAFVGVVDRVRVGRDMVALGDFHGLEDIARQLAGSYMLQQKFWVNDSDPLYVGGRDFVHDYGTGPLSPDPSMRDEIRMRLQLQLTSGSPVTIGENMEDMDRERMHLLTLVLPTYGEAATPMDMFRHTIPEEYDLPIRTRWGSWHDLILQNWTHEAKVYRIRFRQLGLSDRKDYLVYSFWKQAYVGEFRGVVNLPVAARSGETYAIRDVPNTPWILSTNMTLSQGAVELHGVAYTRSSNILSGTASRSIGAKGDIIIYAPSGYSVRSGSESYTVQALTSGATLVHLKLKFRAAEVHWWLHFRGPRVFAERSRPLGVPHAM